MTQFIRALFEDGMFKPLSFVRFPEHLKVILAVNIPTDDVPSLLLNRLAEESPSYNFLSDPQEDIYTANDGEPC